MPVRIATKEDFHQIIAIDSVKTSEREREVTEFINSKKLYVYQEPNHIDILGYIVLDRSFFNNYFVNLIIVSQENRQMGVGTILMEYVQNLCDGKKVFTSTNQSNVPAQKFFEKHGFKKTGFIEGLDEGDPEIIYIKSSQGR